jgi:hypothetical protein
VAVRPVCCGEAENSIAVVVACQKVAFSLKRELAESIS